MEAKGPAAIGYPPEQILEKREQVRRAFLARSENVSGGTITSIATSDLELLFEQYDAVFLHGYFKRNFTGTLSFSLSTRMSKSAGKTIFPRNLQALQPGQEKFELRMGINLFFSYRRLDGEKKVNGIRTRDALEAFQLVFEHELCHLIELHLFRQSSCKQRRFKSIARNIFGHTESYHQLPTVTEIAGAQYGLNVGDRVRFNHGGKTLDGYISRINRRATVMVRDKAGPFRDRKGDRYARWYVPLPLLEKCDGGPAGK